MGSQPHPKLKDSSAYRQLRHRLAWFGLLCLTAVVLSACDDTPVPTATTQPTDAPTPLATSTPTSSATLAPTPTATATPTPEPLSAKDVLRATTAAMGAVESGHVEVDIATQTEGVMALDIEMRMVRDFEAPDRNHFLGNGASANRCRF